MNSIEAYFSPQTLAEKVTIEADLSHGGVDLPSAIGHVRLDHRDEVGVTKLIIKVSRFKTKPKGRAKWEILVDARLNVYEIWSGVALVFEQTGLTTRTADVRAIMFDHILEEEQELASEG